MTVEDAIAAVKLLRPEPGEVLFIETAEDLTEEATAAMLAELRGVSDGNWPVVPCVIVGANVTVEALDAVIDQLVAHRAAMRAADG